MFVRNINITLSVKICKIMEKYRVVKIKANISDRFLLRFGQSNETMFEELQLVRGVMK